MNDEVDVAGSDRLDELLAIRASQGDTAAFGALYDRYARRVARLLRTYARDQADLEDMVHDTFCRVMDALPSYRSQGAFRSWLFTIALNVGRKAARRHDGSVPLTEECPTASSDMESGGLLPVEAETLARRLLAALSEPKRLVVVMRIWLDLPYEEIAAILSIPPATARTRMHSALHDLRTLLAHEASEEVRTA
ncbi:MAG: RNA polymerase sigma factor [Candidatus Eisenbacteria bacterium]|nr:RNA polymerase sigma factor [Candidatus Eisenbacteria bacterium]